MSEFKIGSYTIDIPWPIGPTFYPVDQKEFQKALANLELGMNWAGYVVPFLPFIGNWAGKLRIVGGSAEGLIGLALSAIRFGQAYWEKDEIKKEEKMNRVWESWEYAKHGAANIGRGCLEQIRVVNLLVGYFWDFSGNRMKYQVEKEIDVVKAQKAAGIKV